VHEYRLPTNPDALKETDTRAVKYRERFGDLAVELDALPPATLESIVEGAIRESLDLSLFAEQQAQEEAEAVELDALRERVVAVVEAEQ
jgi:hypothetical protein